MLDLVGYALIEFLEVVDGGGLRMGPVISPSAAACAAFSVGGATRAAAYGLRLHL